MGEHGGEHVVNMGEHEGKPMVNMGEQMVNHGEHGILNEGEPVVNHDEQVVKMGELDMQVMKAQIIEEITLEEVAQVLANKIR